MRQVVYLLFIFQFLFNPISLGQPYSNIWVKNAGGGNSDYGYDIARDLNGNIYITGGFSGNIHFDNILLSSHGSQDMFLAKMDSMGNFMWAINAGGSYGDCGNAISVDVSENIYVVGYFRGTAIFDAILLTSYGQEDIFIANYNSNGNLNWVRQGGGSGEDICSDISVDMNGKLYATGYFEDSANFGGNLLVSNGSSDIFLGKLNSNGDYIWVKNCGGKDFDNGKSLSIDSDGNSYITGSCSDTAFFGTQHVVSYGNSDIYVSKIDSSGDFIWVKHAGSSSLDDGNDIALDTAGNVYIVGQIRGRTYFDSVTIYFEYGTDYFCAKLDNSGNLKWVWSRGSPGWENLNGIAVYPNGDSWIVGDWDKTLLIKKQNSAGHWIWSESDIKIDDESTARGITIGENGKFYVIGSFQGSLWGLNNYGSNDIFIGELFDTSLTVEVSSDSERPSTFSLKQNYPNPFNPITKICYTIKEQNYVKITIHNLIGELVETIVNEMKEAGSYSIEFNAVNLPSGLYFYQLESEGLCETKKMVLLK